MHAAHAIVLQARVFAQNAIDSAPGARTNFPWFWVILIGIAVLALLWYVNSTTGRGKPVDPNKS